ncbi:hypothetical protein QQX98_000636 [Neonectria punicea]|uniref:Uncharacterized protein n=1 Tax=Neonectria punicea TaxID=979145 RepID=A0ABR1HSL9_9HYPO
MAKTRGSRAESKRSRNQTIISKTAFKQDTATQPPTPSKAKSNGKKEQKSKSKSATSSSIASERVQTDVLLAIQPIHLNNIVHQRKNHEYRNYRLCDGVQRLWLYETRGTKQDKGCAAITHIATIPSDIRHTPGNVPDVPFGIDNAEFNSSPEQSGFGYPIVELYQLVEPITLEEMKTAWGVAAPMGWRYVKMDMWENRWGVDENREGKVTRVF